MKTSASGMTDAMKGPGDSLDPASEEALCRLITERTGIVLYDHQLHGLREALTEGCLQFGHPDANAYRRVLADKTVSSRELEFLIARITVGESYFFRDAAQMALLRDNLLPEMIARKRLAGDYSLRVWSAGCSTGQEVYSIAILLHELLPDIDDWNLHLLATDINTEVLASALRGRFRKWSFRATTEAVVKKYFRPAGAEHELHAGLRKLVKFAYLNLAEDAFPSLLTETHALDLILCRNVFIYIEPVAARRIMHRFAECLVPEGLLLLGPADHVDWPAAAFARIQAGDASYLRRLPVREEEATREPQRLQAEQADGGRPGQITEAAVAEALRVLAPGTEDGPRRGGAHMMAERVVELLRAERWRDVLVAVEQACRATGASAGLWQARAKALANLGDLAAALQACEQSLALDPTDKHTYLIQGVVRMELGQPSQAEAALRKAVYLDPAFAEAHYRLGLLLLHLGRRDVGLKSLGNALAQAERSDPHRAIHNASDMSYARFAEILRQEISIHASPARARRTRTRRPEPYSRTEA